MISFALTILLFGCCVGQISQMYSPFLPNETWWCSQGNDKSYSHSGTIKYSWDFNWGTGWDDETKPLIATHSGKVTYANYYGGAWGNIVTISYGEYYVPEVQSTLPHFGYVAHLNAVFVKPGEEIKQGQVIGLVGGTGSTSSHIHYHVAKGGLDPSSGSISTTFTDIGVPDGASDFESDPSVSHCTSGNVYIFDQEIIRSGGYSAFGQSIELNEYGWWKPWLKNQYDNVYMTHPPGQPITGGTLSNPHIIYDAMRGARDAVLCFGRIYNHWVSQNGPESYLGAPIGCEYVKNTYTYQDFQGGQIIWNGYSTWHHQYPENYGPGTFDYYTQVSLPGLLLQPLPGGSTPIIGWSPTVSYLFVDAYNRNGGAAKVGYPYAGAYGAESYAYVHPWYIDGNPQEYLLVQNFKNGEYGDCVIIYNGNNPSGSIGVSGENKAYLLRSGFWAHYRDNDGISNLGSPLGEEFSLGLGAKQIFEKGFLVWDGTYDPGNIVVFQAPGIKRNKRQVTIIPKQTTISSLKKKTSSIASVGSGVEIWNNGKLMGVTPYVDSLYQEFVYDMTAKTVSEAKDFNFTVGGENMVVEVDILPYYIIIDDPIAGNKYEIENLLPISYSANVPGGRVKVQLTRDNGGTWETILADAPANNNVSWIATGAISNLCYIKVTCLADPSIEVLSGQFRLISRLTIAGPNGGENMLSGGVVDIMWDGGNCEFVKIYFSSDAGLNWYLQSTTENTGSWRWTIPSIASTRCLVKVAKSEDVADYDTSDNMFTINLSPQPPDFPFTLEAEDMDIGGLEIAGGRKIVTPSSLDKWYLLELITLPTSGWVQAEVIARAEGQVDNRWPVLKLAGPRGSFHTMEVNSTEWKSYYFIYYLNLAGQDYYQILMDASVHGISGLSVQVDKSIISYFEPQPILVCAPPAWITAATVGQSNEINVVNNGTGPYLVYNATESLDWLSISSTSGVTPGSFNISVIENSTGWVRAGQIVVSSVSSISARPVSITQPPHGQSVYFNDNFNRQNLDANWEIAGGGTVSIENYSVDGALKLSDATFDNTLTTAILNNSLVSFIDQILTFNYDNGLEDKVNSTSYVYVRYIDQNNHYYLKIIENDYDVPNSCSVYIGKKVNGVEQQLAYQDRTQIIPGSYLFGFIDSELVFRNLYYGTSITLSAIDHELSGIGTIGFAVDGEDCTVDNLVLISKTKGIKVAGRAFLEGPYNLSNHKMNVGLSGTGQVPLASPYPDIVSAVSIPDSIVDWVWIKLRQTTNGPDIAAKSAWLSQNGIIVDPKDGSPYLHFDDLCSGRYYIILQHRNHLAIMGQQTLLSDQPALYSFAGHSIGSPTIYGNNAAKEVEPGLWALIGGDGNNDGAVDVKDYAVWQTSARQGDQPYHMTDYNLDGRITTVDYVLWFKNWLMNYISQVP